MTDGARLEAIFDRLGKMEKESARHHALMEGEIARVGDKLADLDARVKIQNSRVTKAEHRISELETQRRIETSHESEDEAKAAVVSTRVWALLTGSFLVILGAVIGYFL